MPRAPISPAPCRIANRGGAPRCDRPVGARHAGGALKAYVLFGGIDPAVDLAVTRMRLRAPNCVVALTTHLPESLRARVHVVLPIGSFAETAGTFVNVEGRWQSWKGRREAAGREPAGLEGAASARESAEPAGLRLREQPRRCARR
jgi:NADH dehydrogenase/NADH:ubiquinone oxidoreductase subunit G